MSKSLGQQFWELKVKVQQKNSLYGTQLPWKLLSPEEQNKHKVYAKTPLGKYRTKEFKQQLIKASQKKPLRFLNK